MRKILKRIKVIINRFKLALKVMRVGENALYAYPKPKTYKKKGVG